MRPFLIVLVLSLVAGGSIGIAPELLLFAPRTTSPTVSHGAPRIIDGDTVQLGGQRIRLAGIDAPETSQFCFNDEGSRYPCGRKATNYLAKLVGSDPLTCEGDEMDRYGRLIAICYAKEKDINAAMVAGGWAVAYRHYSPRYISEEEMAKASLAGLWQGSFQMPWAWRQDKRPAEIPVSTVHATACDIKGNISDNGKIYHLPGGRWYEETTIDPARGERWFCNEREAR
ncbi:MAG: thermonuclease family protein, partial [Alphaproteobacteria bacterium]